MSKNENRGFCTRPLFKFFRRSLPLRSEEGFRSDFCMILDYFGAPFDSCFGTLGVSFSCPFAYERKREFFIKKTY